MKIVVEEKIVKVQREICDTCGAEKACLFKFIEVKAIEEACDA